MLSKLQAEMKTAMKAGDKSRVMVLRNIIARIKSKQIEAKDALSDADCLKIIQGIAKQIKDSIQQFKKGGRDDLVESEEIELSIVESYLPEALSEEEIRNIVVRIVRETGASAMSDLGKVMPLIMKEIAGKGDGKLASRLVRETLS